MRHVGDHMCSSRYTTRDHSGFCEIQYHLPVVSVSLYRETNHYALQVSSSYNSVVFPVPGSISDQYTRLSPIWPRESGVRLPARETSGFVSDLIQWVLLARRTFRKVNHQRIMHQPTRSFVNHCIINVITPYKWPGCQNNSTWWA